MWHLFHEVFSKQHVAMKKNNWSVKQCFSGFSRILCACTSLQLEINEIYTDIDRKSLWSTLQILPKDQQLQWGLWSIRGPHIHTHYELSPKLSFLWKWWADRKEQCLCLVCYVPSVSVSVSRRSPNRSHPPPLTPTPIICLLFPLTTTSLPCYTRPSLASLHW